MKLYNTLTRQTTLFEPLAEDQVTMYSCGPTVYDHIHIGNLSAFICADTLRRTLKANDYNVNHVMNFTDVDDKTIRRSHEIYPDESPEVALQKLTRNYEAIFLHDMQAIGNDIDVIQFVRATERIEDMKNLIIKLHEAGFAYVTDDGVYFSIEKYKASGKKYGQLLTIAESNTSTARIDNDEYDKESVHDFALWKTHKDNEPAWELQLGENTIMGRPGWHVECSAMSANMIGQPFDIHTGGVDLIFPHHENEIAQSTAGESNSVYANYFVHNEHLLVDGKKMSKSLDNFFTLRDIQERGINPLAFRLLTLQSHYRSQTNFSWDNLEAAQNRLNNWQAIAVLRWQPAAIEPNREELIDTISVTQEKIKELLADDLNTPLALAEISKLFAVIELVGIAENELTAFNDLLKTMDALLGLQLRDLYGISHEQKDIIRARQEARNAKDWAKADQLRDQLSAEGIGLRDVASGQIWFRL